jgi:two-component system response regulator YesN
MTVLLVDDEVQLRNYLRTLVDWEGQGYRFLEAENGAAAIEVMKRTQIHLLMLDITMPVMTGLEVLEWVNENRYNCVTAILTSHDEFGYAQTALRLGCFDYLVKSEITGESILALAGRMQREMSEELQQQQRRAAMEIAARRQETAEIQNIINFWLKSEGKGTQDVTRYFEERFGFSDADNRYVLLRIVIQEYATVVNRYADSDIVRFSVVFGGVLDELLDGYSFLCTECGAGDYLLFLRFDLRDSLHELLDRMRKLTQRIDNSFTNLLGIYCSLVFTLPFLHIASSLERYDRLNKLQVYSFWHPPEEILCLEDFVFDEQIFEDELSVFHREFSQELTTLNLLSIEIKYDSMVAKIIGRRYCLQPSAFKSVCAACVSVFLLNQSQNAADIQSLSSLESNALFKAALLALIQPFCILEGDQDKKLLIKKALLLIQRHFQEDIGLDWLASRLSVNASYLSRVFSAETGQPTTSYIQSYRIEQAKRLIRTTNLKLYEVAERTGFLSQIVFSSTFKKIAGETPTEYRNRAV